MAWQFFKSLGLTRFSLQLNSIGDRRCRPGYLQALKKYYAGHSEDLCPDCRRRLERSPLRLLDCKTERCQALAEVSPRSVGHLCPDCARHFERLQGYLGLLGLPFQINHRLVRGLDYYTRTVFEIQPEAEGAQSALGGGGRYDDLIEELGGKPTPGIGFGIGMERTILNIKEQEIPIPLTSPPHVFIAHIGELARAEAMKLASRLRQEGGDIVQAFTSRSLKAQMRQADALGADYAVIIGEEEVRQGTAILRDMKTSQQKVLSINELLNQLRQHWGGGKG